MVQEQKILNQKGNSRDPRKWTVIFKGLTSLTRERTFFFLTSVLLSVSVHRNGIITRTTKDICEYLLIYKYFAFNRFFFFGYYAVL